MDLDEIELNGVIKIISIICNLAKNNKLVTDIYSNQKGIEKRLSKIEEDLEIESEDFEFKELEKYNLKQELKNELQSELNLEIIDQGQVNAGEYFRIKYFDKRWQICFGELDKVNIRNINENINDNILRLTFEHPINYSKAYFVFLNDPKFKTENISGDTFDVEVKFDNIQDLDKFKEKKKIELNKVNYFSLGEWG